MYKSNQSLSQSKDVFTLLPQKSNKSNSCYLVYLSENTIKQVSIQVIIIEAHKVQLLAGNTDLKNFSLISKLCLVSNQRCLS